MLKSFSWMKRFDGKSTLPTNSKLSILVILICIDLIIIGLNFYNSWIPDDQWTEFLAIGSDESIGEYFQYFKWFVISVLFIVISVKRSSLSFLAWFLLFLYLLLDDSLRIHEVLGAYIMNSDLSDTSVGLRSQDIGELLVSAMAGSILLLVFILAYKKGRDFFKITTLNMFYLFLALVFFGVFFDLIAVMVYGGDATLAFFFDVFEDGGEMIVASLMFWYAILILDAKKLPISLIATLRNLFSFRNKNKYA